MKGWTFFNQGQEVSNARHLLLSTPPIKVRESDTPRPVSEFFSEAMSHQWSITKRLEPDLSVRIDVEYDTASSQLSLSAFHGDALQEEAWQWRTGCSVIGVAPDGGAARLLATSLDEGIVLEPKGCVLRWLLHWCLGWEKMHLRLHSLSGLDLNLDFI